MTKPPSAAELFASHFGSLASGVWSAPGRVNIIGEHTDYTGGLCLPIAIQERASIALRPRTDRVVRAVSRGHAPAEVHLDEVGVNNELGWLAYLAGAAWVAEASGRVPPGKAHGWDIALDSSVPQGAGLSSSAAITCAALTAMNDEGDWKLSRHELARWGQRVENDVVGVPCGVMDHLASILGRADSALLIDARSGETSHVPWLRPESRTALIVTNTNAPHSLADGEYAERRRNCERAMAVLGVESLRDATLSQLDAARDRLTAEESACARHVVTENRRVIKVLDLLAFGAVAELGEVLSASHASLRDDFRATIPQLDVSVAAAIESGAWGARMTGGGFGGSTIALVDQERTGYVMVAIDRAFARAGFAAPEHFIAQASDGSRRDA